MIDSTRGFITVAIGNRFHKMAINLVLSYRKFSDNGFRFGVITEKGGEGGIELEKYFDDVIYVERPYKSYLDKLSILYYTPYEETIFIDADSNVVSNIDFLFDAFEKSGSDVSCLGNLKRINEKNRPYMFGDIAVNKYGIDSFISFNGGVYYFKKTAAAKECVDRMFDEILPNYDSLGLVKFRGDKMGDEPIVSLSMLISGFKPLSTYFDVMRMMLHKEDFRSMKWFQKRKICSFLCYGKWVSPKILHWHSSHVDTFKYDYYNIKIRENLPIKKFVLILFTGVRRIVLYCCSLLNRCVHKLKRLL